MSATEVVRDIMLTVTTFTLYLALFTVICEDFTIINTTTRRDFYVFHVGSVITILENFTIMNTMSQRYPCFSVFKVTLSIHARLLHGGRT